LSTFARDQLAGMGVEEMREYDKVCNMSFLSLCLPILFVLFSVLFL
jgi:hypothetical protein